MMLTKKIPDSFNQGILFGFREFLETNWPGLPKNQWAPLVIHISRNCSWLKSSSSFPNSVPQHGQMW